MIYPQKKKFNLMAEKFNLIPVFIKTLADTETPISLFQKTVLPGKPGFLLESGELGERERYSFIGFEPICTLSSRKGHSALRFESARKDQTLEGGNPWEDFRHFLTLFNAPENSYLPPYWGGAVGFFGYEMVHYADNLPFARPERENSLLPDSSFMVPRQVLAFDHKHQEVTIIYNAYLDEANKSPGEIYDQAQRALEQTLGKIKKPAPYQKGKYYKGSSAPAMSSIFSEEDFKKGVKKIKEHIKQGDLFQGVLARKLKGDACRVNSFSVYRSLRSLNPSPYQFFLQFEDLSLVGASPEMLTRVQQNQVLTCPIAGTRPRGKDAEEDDALAKDLVEDEKERAEHLMLVDLGRNDLGKVSSFGSVKVTKFMEVERYSHVMHMVSLVEGALKPELDAVDALKAVFPAGTVSGAPKIKAMEILSGLEPEDRGPYAGSVGYFAFDGSMDTCITIRTLIFTQGQVFLQTGSGIVADSDPQKELEETLHKAKGCLQALQKAGGVE